MPYVSCGGCGLRYYTAAAFTTRGHCPSCGVPARARTRARGLDDAAFASLYDQRAEQLLAFFLRRAPSRELAVHLWAETFANAWSIRNRFRGGSREQAASWLEAIAYRQLARCRSRDDVDPVHLRRLGLRAPDDDPADVVKTFRRHIVPDHGRPIADPSAASRSWAVG